MSKSTSTSTSTRVSEDDKHFVESTLKAAGQTINFDTFVLHDLYVTARNANLKYQIYKAKMEGHKKIFIEDCDTYTVTWLKNMFGPTNSVESTYNRNRKADVTITF